MYGGLDAVCMPGLDSKINKLCVLSTHDIFILKVSMREDAALGAG
jgi:hypothetical protein